MKEITVKAILLGIVAGMRTVSAPAFVMSLTYSRPRSQNPIFIFMRSRHFHGILKIAAVGEMIADKLPFISDRISPGPLLARTLSGAFCGGLLFKESGKREIFGAATGGFTALVSTSIFYHIRKLIGIKSGVHDAIIGFCEDIAATAIGMSAFKKDLMPKRRRQCPRPESNRHGAKRQGILSP